MNSRWSRPRRQRLGRQLRRHASRCTTQISPSQRTLATRKLVRLIQLLGIPPFPRHSARNPRKARKDGILKQWEAERDEDYGFHNPLWTVGPHARLQLKALDERRAERRSRPTLLEIA